MRSNLRLAGLALVLCAGCFQADTAQQEPNGKNGVKKTDGAPADGAKKVPVKGTEHVLTFEKPVVIDGVKVELTVAVFYPLLNDEKGRTSSRFAVATKITNETATEIVMFTPWHHSLATKLPLIPADQEVAVRDEFGNAYFVFTDHDFKKVRIDPSGSHQQAIQFDPVQAACKQIIITVPASCFSRPGHTITIRVPRDRFKIPGKG